MVGRERRSVMNDLWADARRAAIDAGQQLQACRRHADVTLRDLCHELGAPTTAAGWLSRIERGTAIPTSDQAEPLQAWMERNTPETVLQQPYNVDAVPVGGLHRTGNPDTSRDAAACVNLAAARSLHRWLLRRCDRAEGWTHDEL